MVKPPKHCIYCGQTGNMSKEDVWPTWLHGLITRNIPSYALRDLRFDSLKNLDKATATEKKKSGDPRTLRVRWVCQGCNNGWMSQLQEKAKPIVLPFMHGEQSVLNQDQQKTFAGWAAMNVMTAEFRDVRNLSVSAVDRKSLMETRVPPENWKIWIGNLDTEKWKAYYIHHRMKVLPDDAPLELGHVETVPIDVVNGCARFYNTQTTTIIYEKLYIYAFSSDVALFTKEFSPGPVCQLWPIKEKELRWPPLHSLKDIDAEQVTGSIFGAAHRAVKRERKELARQE